MSDEVSLIEVSLIEVSLICLKSVLLKSVGGSRYQVSYQPDSAGA